MLLPYIVMHGYKDFKKWPEDEEVSRHETLFEAEQALCRLCNEIDQETEEAWLVTEDYV